MKNTRKYLGINYYGHMELTNSKYNHIPNHNNWWSNNQHLHHNSINQDTDQLNQEKSRLIGIM